MMEAKCLLVITGRLTDIENGDGKQEQAVRNDVEGWGHELQKGNLGT